MNRRLTTPVAFGHALKMALDYRQAGQSTIVAAIHSLDTIGLTRDWAVPLIATLDSSPSVALAWAERMQQEAVDRAAGRVEGARHG